MEENDHTGARPMRETEEQEVSRLLRSALDAPARPLRGDQIELLVAEATRRLAPGVPMGLLALLGFGLPLISGFIIFSGAPLTGLMQIALIIPLANLLLGPLAAFIIIQRARDARSPHRTGGNHET